MKLGSIGEIPPSTMGSSGFTLRIALPAAIAISANFLQSGSRLKSQWERLLGSFQSITASTIGRSPVAVTARLSTPSRKDIGRYAARYAAHKSRSQIQDAQQAQGLSYVTWLL